MLVTTAYSLPEEMAHLINDETETAEYGRLNAFLQMHQDLNTSQLLKKCLQLALRNELRKIFKHLVINRRMYLLQAAFKEVQKICLIWTNATYTKAESVRTGKGCQIVRV